MWWNIAPEVRADFEHWHAHEHFPERLGIPGFLRASRWTAADDPQGMFVMYELRDHDVLSSPAYLARLNAPTPWSTRLMPHHRDMVRTQCRVLESQGALAGRAAVTVRLSPQPGRGQELRAAIAALAGRAAGQPGCVGVHLLQHQPPALAPTTEQRIRGLSDAGADWVIVGAGYDLRAVTAWGQEHLASEALERAGAMPGASCRVYELAYCAVGGELS